MIEAVIFDMDGLLIDSESLTFQLYREICLKHGTILDEEFYLSLLGTNGQFIAEALGQYLENKTLAVQIMDEVHKGLEIHFEKRGIPLKTGAEELVDYLRMNGVKMAVATSSSRSRALKMLEKSELISAFDAVVCGDEVECSKPHPDIFLKAAKALATDPSKIMVLEDSENGIIGGHAGGMRCIHVPDLKSSTEDILSRVDFVAADLLEVIEIWPNASLR